MAVEENKAVVRRINNEVISGKNLALADELFSSEYIVCPSLPGRPPGPENAKRAFSMLHAAFPDLQANIESMVAEGDAVATSDKNRGPVRLLPTRNRLKKVFSTGSLAINEVVLGHRLRAEVNVAVSPDLSVAEGHAVAREVNHRLLHELRYLDTAVVHVDLLDTPYLILGNSTSSSL